MRTVEKIFLMMNTIFTYVIGVIIVNVLMDIISMWLVVPIVICLIITIPIINMLLYNGLLYKYHLFSPPGAKKIVNSIGNDDKKTDNNSIIYGLVGLFIGMFIIVYSGLYLYIVYNLIINTVYTTNIYLTVLLIVLGVQYIELLGRISYWSYLDMKTVVN
jgi:hypothetical protein